MTEESRRLASYGRYGDNNLVHVSNRELAGLETLTGRRFTHNPHTGLPEAFGFEDMLPAIAGLVATIATSGAAAPALYGALASAATSTAVGAAKGESIGTALTSGLISGIGSYAGAGVLGGVAEAAGGAATGAATDVLPQVGADLAGGVANGTEAIGIGSAASGGVPGAASTEAVGVGSSSGGGFMGTGSPSPGGAGATPVSGNAAVNTMNNFYGGAQSGGMPDTSRLDAVAGGYQTTPGVPQQQAPLAQFGQIGGGPNPSSYAAPTTATGTPSATTNAPMSIADRASMNLGNVVNNPTAALDKIGSNLTTLDGLKGAGMLAGSAYMASTLAPPKKPKLPGETPWDYNSTIPATSRPMTMPGPGYRPGFSPEARYFADGGLASLGGDHRHGTTANIVHEAKAAMMGEHPHPKQALQRFRETFGDSALRALSESFAEGGRIRGAGGGLDDLVPGTIEGRQKVRLADGEFVVSSDVVSALGDGSTDQGVRKLQEMMNRVRRDKTGKVKQPGPISHKALPA